MKKVDAQVWVNANKCLSTTLIKQPTKKIYKGNLCYLPWSNQTVIAK